MVPLMTYLSFFGGGGLKHILYQLAFKANVLRLFIEVTEIVVRRFYKSNTNSEKHSVALDKAKQCMCDTANICFKCRRPHFVSWFKHPL